MIVYLTVLNYPSKFLLDWKKLFLFSHQDKNTKINPYQEDLKGTEDIPAVLSSIKNWVPLQLSGHIRLPKVVRW